MLYIIMYEQKPSLVEPGMKYFINETLHQCKIIKDKYQNIIFNFSLLIGIIVILGTFMYFRYKGKLSKEEIIKKDIEKQKYIMSKIFTYRINKQQEKGEISGLPNLSPY